MKDNNASEFMKNNVNHSHSIIFYLNFAAQNDRCDVNLALNYICTKEELRKRMKGKNDSYESDNLIFLELTTI